MSSAFLSLERKTGAAAMITYFSKGPGIPSFRIYRLWRVLQCAGSGTEEVKHSIEATNSESGSFSNVFKCWRHSLPEDCHAFSPDSPWHSDLGSCRQATLLTMLWNNNLHYRYAAKQHYHAEILWMRGFHVSGRYFKAPSRVICLQAQVNGKMEIMMKSLEADLQSISVEITMIQRKPATSRKDPGKSWEEQGSAAWQRLAGRPPGVQDDRQLWRVALDGQRPPISTRAFTDRSATGLEVLVCSKILVHAGVNAQTGD
ncbi:predicted protein [Plenodomus lingam JN3]|uniref:Predicted protein n=1 Tax=Leptosphaeria maculans (strain JN3 / isolate v23.1.3 / race Av1-4-5-6-7-8) TaxID=985895 RepID=E4ZRI6_LEPMJ|nr:predicted protein [Plenodomus lingam JN3]CBX93833.1 predicted protein [Plenodomus lingam JN3]